MSWMCVLNVSIYASACSADYGVVVSAGVYGCEFLQCECCSDYVIMIV